MLNWCDTCRYAFKNGLVSNGCGTGMVLNVCSVPMAYLPVCVWFGLDENNGNPLFIMSTDIRCVSNLTFLVRDSINHHFQSFLFH